MPWPIPSAKTIFERIATSIEEKLSRAVPNVDPAALSRAARSSHGMISLLERPVALEAREIHDHVAFYARQYFPNTAEEEFVERHASIWGIQPRPAIAATGHIFVEGSGGTVIAAGTEFSTINGIIVKTTDASTINENGSVRIPVECTITGVAGNLGEGIAANTVEPFPAINRAIVAAPGLTGGAEAETWQELQTRVLQRIRQPPHGGASFDYKEWLSAKFDLRAVSVEPDWIGRGSVGLIVAMKDGNSGRPPSEDEKEAMLDYIGRPGSPSGVRPVTAHVVIVAATAKILPLRVRVRPFNTATKKAIEDAWAAFISTIGDENDDGNETAIGATIERSRVIEALSAAAGEYAHDLIEPAKTITLAKTEYPVAGPVQFELPK